MVLASAKGSEHSGRKPIFDMLLGATVFANACGAAFYMYNMIFKQKRSVCIALPERLSILCLLLSSLL